MPTPQLKKAENGTYYIHWSEGRRSKRISTHQTEERPAQVYLANWLLNEHKATPGQAASIFTAADLWGQYTKRHKVASETTRESLWKNLKPHFGALTPAKITYDVVEDYIELRESGLIGKASVSATIRHELVILRACFNWCAHPKQHIITKAEVPNYDLPAESDPRDRWLRHEETQRVMDAAAEMRKGPRLSRVERFLWLALETAARKTAICELTWDRVDFETKIIDYDVPGRVKTKKRRAQVPISNALLPILKRMHAERTGDLVMDNKAEIYVLVKKVAAVAKVDDVTPHVMRHTAATHMARRGVPLWIIAGILKVTLATVERTYAKHCPEGMADAVNMISGGVLEQAE